MSELFSEGGVRRCGVCGKATRPPGTKKVDYPGTVCEETVGTCRTCWRKARDLRPPMLGSTCIACDTPIRPQRSNPADYQLGAVIGRAGKCNTCYRRDLAEMDLAADSLVRPVLAPNPLHPRFGAPATSTPNPYVCACGYQVITHTTVEASRHHAQLVRQHARKCGK